MRHPFFMGNSLVGVRVLLPPQQIPRDPLFGTRAVAVQAQYADEVRIPGQPRFKYYKQVDPRFTGDAEEQRRQSYVCFSRDNLLKFGLDPDALKGAQITGYMRNGVWAPVQFEVADVPPRGHLPRVGPILIKVYLRSLKDLQGAEGR